MCTGKVTSTPQINETMKVDFIITNFVNCVKNERDENVLYYMVGSTPHTFIPSYGATRVLQSEVKVQINERADANFTNQKSCMNNQNSL